MGRRKSNVLPFRKPFRAVPLRRVVNTPGGSTRLAGLWHALVRWRLRILLAVFLVLVAADSFRGGAVAHWGFAPWTPEPTASDPEAAWFQLCVGPVRYTCVVDGDTIWYHGEKIRVLDIDAPEVSSPECRREAELGERATLALRDVLNEGPFSLSRDGFEPNRDRFGRQLRRVTREGEPIAERLIGLGLAVRYRAAGPGWCDD
ncbi:thermonuclease family protein [Erythrobacter alti]|uniref:thermonuclease family protein n=1 Tax=Erythrobacter alti TaxID=1896145 RepID=UPI0030F3B1B2